MKRIVEKVVFAATPKPKLSRVAAYARVSSDKDAMHHSLSAQVEYYRNYITSHHGWQFAGVYADEAKTGTKDTRENFVRLLSDCRNGSIDAVITKSVSRFARNTVTLLETVRELKDLGIDVYFEEQNIHTLGGDGELILTILASFAQEESLSASENQKWRIKKNFSEGKPWNGTILGYRYENGILSVEPAEAEIVKRIFALYLSGKGTPAIATQLNEEGIPTRLGNRWGEESVAKLLRNGTYTGNLLLQKTYRENHISKKKCQNLGELPQYLATDAHEAIIDEATFDAVQTEMKRRADKYKPKKTGTTYPFTGLITCGICGKHYRRKTTATGPVWICSTYNNRGKKYCASKAIPESTLLELTRDMPMSEITAVCAEQGNTLTFTNKDGQVIVKRWKDRSRSESWTAEMRAKVGRKTRERSKRNG